MVVSTNFGKKLPKMQILGHMDLNGAQNLFWSILAKLNMIWNFFSLNKKVDVHPSCMFYSFNPKRTRGVEFTPSTFRTIISQDFFFFRSPRFRNFFLSSLAQLFVKKFWSYATLCNRASAKNLAIFWICVQNIWKIAFSAKNPFWALKVCYLPWF